MSKFIATHSKLSKFRDCPRKFWLLDGSKHINGKAVIPFQTNKAMTEGGEKHELMHTAGLSLKLGREFPVFSSPHWKGWWEVFLRRLVKGWAACLFEEKIGVSNDWHAWDLEKYYAVRDKKEFYSDPSRRMIVRGAIDAMFFDKSAYEAPENVLAVDWKSGKPRKSEDEFGQTALYALMIFCKWPSVQKVECLYVFLDHKKFDGPVTYTRDKHMTAIANHYLNQIAEVDNTFLMLSSVDLETAFYPTPGSCHWCPATRRHCQHSRQR